ncbi:hypothetical protein COU54_04435 [Candidatus Pacearchaeota archaeon CG10_big_fil_rev_8_21_14_0_10_31_24]|nr:MAG: hypothetical protein COU54_04435 [Candidatus Pacearchaeota archaeon CG10_big_fil_rev_8_21_14_0_10_31_24]
MKIGFKLGVLIVALIVALLAISPSFEKGVLITSVDRNSTAFEEGLKQGMVIKSINAQSIANSEDYSSIISNIFSEENVTKKTVISTDSGEYILFDDKSPKITVRSVPRSKIKTGLDLSGGARALITTSEVKLTDNQNEELIAVMNERLNVFGIKDVSIRSVKDLEGNNFVLVEIAGATPDDIENLLAKQGKFEAKIGNETVFIGGENIDISDVCRTDATCANVLGCSNSPGGGSSCRFAFTVYLTDEAAKRHADITDKLELDETGQYLSQNLDLLIDGVEVDSLLISSGLKGQVTSQISIQGSGTGSNQEEALKDARASMNKLQTILITGSLPYKLEIAKLDTISPLLGKEFTRSLIELAIAVFLIVSLAVFIRYRKLKITLSVIMTMISEAVITLGIAALINWNLDAPSIAGIIAGIGTGINDQIVIIDESVSNKNVSIGERVKRALFIILGAFFTIVAAMLPLFWAGAGLLKGFAFTTIIGVTVGILITRPAFAELIRRIEQ